MNVSKFWPYRDERYPGVHTANDVVGRRNRGLRRGMRKGGYRAGRKRHPCDLIVRAEFVVDSTEIESATDKWTCWTITGAIGCEERILRSEEHTSELQSHSFIS